MKMHKIFACATCVCMFLTLLSGHCIGKRRKED